MAAEASDIAKHSLEVMPLVSSRCHRRFLEHMKAKLAAKDIQRERPTVADLKFLAGFDYQEGRNLAHIAKEPFVVRVDAKSAADGQVRTYYFARGAYPTQTAFIGAEFSDLKAPLGTIASRKPGQSVRVEVPAGHQDYTVLAKLIATVRQEDGIWDGVDNEFYLGPGKVESATSLRFVLEETARALPGMMPTGKDAGSPEEAPVGPDGEGQKPAWERGGLTKKVISHADLRLRAVLDEHQDEIQRLPLNTKLLLLGPPGTGKTTTLIKRLGQKADETWLSDDEKSLVASQGKNHSTSWVVFTPTELLKAYVRDAFNDEGVPAGKDHILTWEQFRIRLKANALPNFRFNFDADWQPLVAIDARALMAYQEAIQEHVKAAISKAIDRLQSQISNEEDQEKSNRELSESIRKYGTTVMALLYFRQIHQGAVGAAALARPLDWVFDQASRAFASFRKDPAIWERFYAPEAKRLENRISPHELDCMFLVFLQIAKDGLQLASGDVLSQETYLEPLKRMVDYTHFNQVMVDEITDFSPIQLKCITMLANPRIRSIFGCGDFRQRITAHGVPDQDVMRWVDRDFEYRHFQTAYRQSRLLTEFAQAVARIDGATEEQVILPERIGGEGCRPVLSECRAGEEAYSWLTDRVAEIKKQLGRVPSIAIFVDGEDEVPKTVKGMKDLLTDHDISIQACPGGLVLGDAYRVRVFDIHHIKGLEFEAAFLLEIDRIAQHRFDIVNKFLFVGSTRAATYFGVTCAGVLPTHLQPLKEMFAESWDN